MFLVGLKVKLVSSIQCAVQNCVKVVLLAASDCVSAVLLKLAIETAEDVMAMQVVLKSRIPTMRMPRRWS
jgi:hypothetical protein